MALLPVIFNVFSCLFFAAVPLSEKTDPCTEAKAGAAAATLFAKDSLYQAALANIKNAFAHDTHEHCISFGKDAVQSVAQCQPLQMPLPICTIIPTTYHPMLVIFMD
jgi:hypothetical protein